jgi:hypothetical protein
MEAALNAPWGQWEAEWSGGGLAPVLNGGHESRLMLASGSTTRADAAPGLPMVAVYNLTISVNGRVLYAATHGRGAWRIDLP